MEGQENEAGKLFDATNEIIRRMTRYATQISELNTLGANRREEYAKVASVFLKCQDLQEAHRLSAMVFGIEELLHLKGNAARETDSMNSSVYEEKPGEIELKPRIRYYQEKSRRSSMRDYTKEKEEMRRKTMEEIKEDRKKVLGLEQDRQIHFGKLPVISPRVRQILLGWISNALENADHCARTDDGREYFVKIDSSEKKCVIHCEDGNFIMPEMVIVFKDR